MFRLGKQPDGAYPPVPKPKLFGLWEIRVNETSLPSLLFYLDPLFRGRPTSPSSFDPVETDPVVIETDSMSDLVSAKKPLFVVTRPGRLKQNEGNPRGEQQIELEATVETFWIREAAPSKESRNRRSH
jgi:hypothetical protein